MNRFSDDDKTKRNVLTLDLKSLLKKRVSNVIQLHKPPLALSKAFKPPFVLIPFVPGEHVLT